MSVHIRQKAPGTASTAPHLQSQLGAAAIDLKQSAASVLIVEPTLLARIEAQDVAHKPVAVRVTAKQDHVALARQPVGVPQLHVGRQLLAPSAVTCGDKHSL